MPHQIVAEPQNHPIRDRQPDCRWLVFDAVGTLIEPVPAVAVAYHTVGSRFGSQLNLEEVRGRFCAAFRDSEQKSFPGSAAEVCVTSDVIEEARWRWIVRQVFSDVGDYEGCFRDLWDHFARPSSWRCFEDVGHCVSQLSDSGYQLAIASNFDRRLHAVCDAFPELSKIECRVVSAEVGYRKPSPAFYAAILQACQCESSQIMMIGDSLEHDVYGPQSAGLSAIHLDRHNTSVDESRICSLTELMQHESQIR